MESRVYSRSIGATIRSSYMPVWMPERLFPTRRGHFGSLDPGFGDVDVSSGGLDLDFGTLNVSSGSLDLDVGALDVSFGSLDLS